MYTGSIAQLLALGLLVVAPLASAVANPTASQDVERRHVVRS